MIETFVEVCFSNNSPASNFLALFSLHIVNEVSEALQDDFNQWNRPLCKNVSYFRAPREVMRVYVVTIPFYNE